MNVDGKISTFDAFCRLIAEEAAEDDRFVLLSLERAADAELSKLIPSDKYIVACGSVGAAILRAAGLAIEGCRPVIVGRAGELVGAGYAHIREALALPGLPVRIAAVNGGLSSAREGSAVQFLEDLALMRTIPNMDIFVPSDGAALAGILKESAKNPSPTYIRLGSVPVRELNDESSDSFRSGGARILRQGTGVTVCACGIMVSQALTAAGRLEQQNISAEVIDCYSLKPFPEQILLSSVRKTGCCVAAEEHSVIGGLFGAAAECLARTYPVPMRCVAVADQFVDSGTPEELHGYYGLTWQEIVDAAAQSWALRRR